MADAEKRRAGITKSYANWCVHYSGLMDKTCKKGIDYRALTGGDDFGIALRIPCLKSNESTVVCEHCHYPTEAEVQAHEAEMQAHMERMREDGEIIMAAHEKPEHMGEAGQTFVYVCELCGRATRAVFSTALQASVHLQEVHQVAHADIVAARGKMAAHYDAADWSQNDDRFFLPDGRTFLLRSVRTPRRGENKAVWSEMKSKKRR